MSSFLALASSRRLSALGWQTLACATARICYGWSYKSPHSSKSRPWRRDRLFSLCPVGPSRRCSPQTCDEGVPYFCFPHRTPAFSSRSTSKQRSSAAEGPCFSTRRSNARITAELLIDRPRKSVASWLSRWSIADSSAERVTL